MTESAGKHGDHEEWMKSCQICQKPGTSSGRSDSVPLWMSEKCHHVFCWSCLQHFPHYRQRNHSYPFCVNEGECLFRCSESSLSTGNQTDSSLSSTFLDFHQQCFSPDDSSSSFLSSSSSSGSLIQGGKQTVPTPRHTQIDDSFFRNGQSINHKQLKSKSSPAIPILSSATNNNNNNKQTTSLTGGGRRWLGDRGGSLSWSSSSLSSSSSTSPSSQILSPLSLSPSPPFALISSSLSFSSSLSISSSGSTIEDSSSSSLGSQRESFPFSLHRLQRSGEESVLRSQIQALEQEISKTEQYLREARRKWLELQSKIPFEQPLLCQDDYCPPDELGDRFTKGDRETMWKNLLYLWNQHQDPRSGEFWYCLDRRWLHEFCSWCSADIVPASSKEQKQKQDNTSECFHPFHPQPLSFGFSPAQTMETFSPSTNGGAEIHSPPPPASSDVDFSRRRETMGVKKQCVFPGRIRNDRFFSSSSTQTMSGLMDRLPSSASSTTVALHFQSKPVCVPKEIWIYLWKLCQGGPTVTRPVFQLSHRHSQTKVAIELEPWLISVRYCQQKMGEIFVSFSHQLQDVLRLIIQTFFPFGLAPPKDYLWWICNADGGRIAPLHTLPPWQTLIDSHFWSGFSIEIQLMKSTG